MLTLHVLIFCFLLHSIDATNSTAYPEPTEDVTLPAVAAPVKTGFKVPEWPAQKYIRIDNFIDKETCNKIIECFKKEIVTKASANANNAFDKRVIYYNMLMDKTIKSRLAEIKYGILSELRKFYQIETIYPGPCHVVRWSPGQSFGLHADNAFYPSGKPNHLHWTTWSGVLFLNSDFEGGEFYFHDYDGQGNERVVKPEPGTMIAFGAGMDFVHGVKEVISGVRYAMPLWYTDDISHLEL